MMARFNMLLVAALVAFACCRAGQAQQPCQLIMDANNIWIRAGESPMLQYRYRGVPFKPYVKELYSPGGVNVLLDAPHDHLHHHGLMFAVGVDGENFWEETPTAGRQNHMAFEDVYVGKHFISPFVGLPAARLKERVSWRDATSQSRLLERRTIGVRQTSTPGTSALATVVTWTSELRVPEGKQMATLGGSHYFGLGMRFPRSMDGTGQFLNADGKEATIFRGEERLVQSNWCAYQVMAEGRRVTVAMFGNCGSRRRPTTWFTMAKPFAYMSATLGLHEEPLEIRSPLPLILMYAVAIWDRHVSPVQIDAYYREWALLDWPINNHRSQDAEQTDKSK
jgi:hypothetical protein